VHYTQFIKQNVNGSRGHTDYKMSAFQQPGFVRTTATEMRCKLTYMFSFLKHE